MLKSHLGIPVVLLLLLLVGCSEPASTPANSEGDTAATTVADEGNENESDTTEALLDEESPEASSDGFTREQTLIASLTIFVLAVFVGFEVITKVPPTLHTPLMSGSNAISGITLVGAALMAGNGESRWAMFFGFLAVVFATVNVAGGFLVTDRMLGMFKRK